MIVYRILFAIDAIAAAILLFFFSWGLSDGTVSSFNLHIWLAMLGGVGLVLAGGLWFGARREYLPGGLVLAILALPCAAFALFFLALVILQPNWH